jgi:hypothetical protein
MQLSRLGRRTVTFDVTATGFVPETVEVGLVPPGGKASAATEWSEVPKVDGQWKRVLTGTLAELVEGSLVVPTTSDMFARLTSGLDILVIKVANGRVTVV